MSPQYGECRPTNAWELFVSLGHPRKFQRVSRLAFVSAEMSLTGGQPNFAWCLAVSCVGTLYTQFRRPCPWRNFTQCKIHFTSKSCFLLYWQCYCAALQQRASAKLCGVVEGMKLCNFRRRHHLYSAGRPSRWASAHILVWFVFTCSRWTIVFMFIRIYQNSKLYRQIFGLINQMFTYCTNSARFRS